MKIWNYHFQADGKIKERLLNGLKDEEKRKYWDEVQTKVSLREQTIQPKMTNSF